MTDRSLPDSRCGWSSDLPRFSSTEARDAGLSQKRAWDDSIPMPQRECRELITSDGPAAHTYTAIREYELPLESRRIDVVVLENGVVVVLELKGKQDPSRADIDQVMAYARDLRAYHEDCHER